MFEVQQFEVQVLTLYSDPYISLEIIPKSLAAT